MTDGPSNNIPRYSLGDFRDLEPIDRGSEGIIYTGLLGHFGQIALKQSTCSLNNCRKEIEILAKHRHPNIVNLYGILWNGATNTIYGYIMEYLPAGNLHNYIHDCTKIYDSSQSCKWIVQIGRGLQFLHINLIIHRDIKPKNILMGGEQLKLADFGTARNDGGSTTAGAGTRRYMAPEVIRGKSKLSSDIYSLAITIWEIFHRKPPFYELGKIDEYELVTQILSGVRPVIVFKDVDEELIQRCWQQNEGERPPIEEIIDYFWKENGLEQKKIFPTFEEVYSSSDELDATFKGSVNTVLPRYVIEDFKGLESIAIGAGGMVSRGKLQDFGEIALKQFVYSRDNPLDKFKKEIDVLIEHRHPNIINLFGILWNGQDQSIYLGYVMEYVEGGSLHDVIHKNTRPYDSPQIYKWVDQIARGLQFLHGNGIIHRDIKPENILVAGNQLKLADFGVAKNIDTSITYGAGTLRYMAPEVFLGECYPSSDIYSLSIVIWEIFHRQQPYYEWGNLSILALIEKINSGARPAIDPGKMGGDVAMLIQRCWQRSPENRPPVREIIDYLEKETNSSNQLTQGSSIEVREHIESLTEQKVVVKSPQEEKQIEKKQRLNPMEKGKSENHQENNDKETILILGGCYEKDLFDDLLLLKENKWSKLSLKLPRKITTHGTVYLNEEIYIFGGLLSNQTDKLDKDLKWVRVADMNEERWCFTNSCLEWKGCIWVFGGCSDFKEVNSLKSVERYDPKENKWTEMPSMNHAREDAAAVVWNGKIMICGGTCNGRALKSVECFDPESGGWTELDDLPTMLSEHVIIPYQNNLVLIGGWDGKKRTNSVLELSTVEGKLVWKKLPSMKNVRCSFSAVVLNDEIHVIGGWDDKVLTGTEIFDGTKWRDGPDLPHENMYMSTIAIPQNFADSLFNYKP